MRIASRLPVGITLLVLAVPAHADSFFASFRDEDGWFDVSDWVLDNAVGFMPLPVTITEPAVGAGLGVAALFFHPPEGYSADEFAARAPDQAGFVVPNISAVAAGITENDTWFVGGGHIAHWRDDTVRYEGMVGFASLNLRFYGLPGSTLQSGEGLAFNADALFLSQPLAVRIGTSNFFLGAEWEYLDMATGLDLGTGIPEIDALRLDTRLSGIGAFIEYDGLDNSFTPNRGINARVLLMRRDSAIGSDWNFGELEAWLHAFGRVGSRVVVGGRIDVQSVSGDVPFFSVPYVDLRGIPAMRYQGDAVLVTEVEVRWAFHPRLNAVGFLGAGKAADAWRDVGSAPTRVTQGLGLRYFIARKLGMHVGFDVARGPEDTHVYLTFGNAWQ